jgi:preprotein translocase subunit SecE
VTETVTKNKFLDISLWLVVAALLVGGIVANYHYSSVDLSLRLIAWLGLVAVLLGIASRTSQGLTAWEFAKEARIELRKVVWPTRQETIQTTVMVIILVMVIALIIWGIDAVFLHLVGWLVGQRG